jgi:hypothetical protein
MNLSAGESDRPDEEVENEIAELENRLAQAKERLRVKKSERQPRGDLVNGASGYCKYLGFSVKSNHTH